MQAPGKSTVLDCRSEFGFSSSMMTSSTEPAVKLAYINSIQSIIIRENGIENLLSLLDHIEQLYWKYVLLRMRNALTSKSELSSLRSQICYRQQELSVALAHHRSISMEVVENIQVYRRIYRKEGGINTDVSIIWQGKNYMLKMLSDYTSFTEHLILKLWLGFTPQNLFLIPPPNFDYNVAKLERDRVYETWLLSHLKYRKDNFREEKSDEILSPVLDISGCNTTGEQEKESQKSYTKISNSVSDTQEINQLREMCLRSFSESSGSIWSDLTISTNLAHAIKGYKELVPMRCLIPDLPVDLVASCSSLERELSREEANVALRSYIEEQSAYLRDNSVYFESKDSLHEIIIGNRTDISLRELSSLKLRQETGAGSKTMDISMMKSASDVFVTLSEGNMGSPFLNGTSMKETSSSYLRLNDQKMHKIVAERVENSRMLVQRSNEGRMEVIESKRRLYHTRKYIPKDEAASKIQRLVHKFLKSCRKFHRGYEERRNYAAVQFQKLLRGYLGRRRFQKALVLFISQFTILRKYVARKQKAAVKITNVIRKAAYVCRKTRESSKENLIEQGRRHKVFQVQARIIDNALILIQKRWRGVLGRRRFMRLKKVHLKFLSVDSRLEKHLLKSASAPLDNNSRNRRGILALNDDETIPIQSSNRPISPYNSNEPFELLYNKTSTIEVEGVKRNVSDFLLQENEILQPIALKSQTSHPVNADIMKTSIRHSILLPLHGRTKGKLLSGKKRALLNDAYPSGTNNTKDVSWKDFYRPPVSDKVHRQALMKRLPILTTLKKNTVSPVANFLQATLDSSVISDDMKI